MVATYNKYKGIEAEGKPEKMLTEMGVAVRDSSGQFRDFSSILDDLNVKWKTMSDTEKIATAQQVAGIQRYNQFMSLMNNYQMAIDSTTTALNSQGSATKENEIYMQSAQAKIEQLKTSLQEMAMNFIDSDGVKTSIDGLNKLVNAFDNLPLVIEIATTALLLFKGKAIKGGIDSIIGYTSTLRSLAVTEGVVATATTELSFVLNKLKGAIMENPLGALAVAFTVIISLSEKYIKTTKQVIENNKEMIDSIKNNEESISSTEKLLQQKTALEQQIGKSNLTEKESLSLKTQLVDVEKQIAEALPDSVSGYTSEGEAISANNELIQKGLDLQKEKIAINSKNTLNQSNSYGSVNAIKSNLEENMKRLNEAKANGEDNYKMSVVDENGEYVNDIMSMVDSSSFKRMSEQLKDLETQAGQTKQAILSLVNQGYSLKDIVAQTNVSSEDVTELMKNLGVTEEEISRSLNGSIIKLSSTIKDTKDLTKNWKAIRKYKDTINVDTTQKSYTESIESVKQLTGWITSMNSENGYTSDIMLEILKVYPQMATYISDTAKVQEELNKKIAEEGDVQKKAYLDLMSKDTNFYDTQIKGTDNWKNIVAKNFELVGKINEDYYKDNANNMQTDLQNANDLAKARASLEGNLISALGKAWEKYYRTLSTLTQSNVKAYDSYGQLNTNNSPMSEQDYNNMGGMDAFGKTLEQMNAERVANNKTITDMDKGLSDSYKAYADGMKELENIGVNIDFKMPETNLGSDGAESTKEAVDYSVQSLESLRDAYQRLNSIIDKTQSELDKLDKKTQNAYGYNKTDLMKQKIQYLEREQELQKELANTYRSEAQSQRNQLSSQGVQFDSDGLITNYNEILEVMRQSANSMSSYDDASKTAKENAIQNVKDLQSSMNEYTNTTIKGLHSAENSWEDLANTIKDQYKEIVQLTATAEDKISDIIQKEIEKRYDKRKEALEKQKQLYEDSYKDEDYEDSKAELEDKIQTINSDLTSAIKSQNQSAIKDLQQQKADAIKELNDLVTDKERENAGGVFDKALEDIDTQKEDMLKTENLTEMVTQAMQSGFINVNGEIINLSDSMNTFLKESVVGTANLKLQMDELATSISNGVAGLKDLGSYSGFLNSSNLVNNTLSENGLSGANGAYYTKNNSSNVTYKAGDVYVQGNVTEDVFPKLKAEMQYIANSEINKFVKYVNGQ